MYAAQREFLEQRFAPKEWPGHTGSGLIKDFQLEGTKLTGWKLLKMKHSEQEGSKVIRSFWSRGDNTDELLSIDVFLCSSVNAAHETLLEALSNMQSGTIARKTGKNTPGDVAFGLADTMIIFARANLVVFIRNAGPTVVPVGGIARDLDKQIQAGTH